MVRPGKARITGEHYTHRHLWHAAQAFLTRGREAESGGGLFDMAALLFVYLSLEAYLNDLGARVAPDDWANERTVFVREPYRGTLGKFRKLAECCKFSVDESRRPFQTLAELESRRDRLVHGRTESLDREVTFKDPAAITEFAPSIYTIAAEPFLTRAFEDTEEICDALHRAALKAFGEHEVPGSRAFIGMAGHQGGTILEMPEQIHPPVI